MTQQDIELLLKDLCARLPYGVKVNYRGIIGGIQYVDSYNEVCLAYPNNGYTVPIEEIKPYLRPLSSMTEEEMLEINALPTGKDNILPNCSEFVWTPNHGMIDWLNSYNFDYRELIEKGLALEAPEEMYL